MNFALCVDCMELSYSVEDSNGVFNRDKAASNHWNHRNIVFGRPNVYVAPVRIILTKLQAAAPISDVEIIAFKIAVELAEDSDIKKWHHNLKAEKTSSRRENNGLKIWKYNDNVVTLHCQKMRTMKS